MQPVFSSYFLIVADFIQWSKDNDVPVGPGRDLGWILGCLCLGITALDQLSTIFFLKGLLIPRDIHARFDIDFCMDKEDVVIDYVAQVWEICCISNCKFWNHGCTGCCRMWQDLGKPYAFG